MSRRTQANVSQIQSAMASAQPSAFRDALVVGVAGDRLELLTLTGDVLSVTVADAGLALSLGEPVAYHPVADILAVGATWVTARA